MLPLGFAFVSWPTPLSDIPKGLFASLTGRFALNFEPRGFTTWWAKMPASGAKMHPQLETSCNGMAAVDMQTMEEVVITIFFRNMPELKIGSRIGRPQAWHMQTRFEVGDALLAVHTEQTTRSASPTGIKDMAGLPSPLGGQLHLTGGLGVDCRNSETRAADRR